MISIKTTAEIELLAEGGEKLHQILNQLAQAAIPGVSTAELDVLAEKLILAAGGQPAFKGYRHSPHDPPFPSTICTSVNHAVVHGQPRRNQRLASGDIIGIDIGMRYQNLYTDMATTVPVGTVTPAATRLIAVTTEALRRGIAAAVVGNTTHDIGRTIQTYVESCGFAVVKDLVGHGVGHAVHEDPRVPNFVPSNEQPTPLEPGLVIAIEPMVTLGTDQVTVANDGWTILTADGSLAAHQEHTIAITPAGPRVLTDAAYGKHFGD